MALVTKYDAVREAQELLLDKCMQVRRVYDLPTFTDGLLPAT